MKIQELYPEISVGDIIVAHTDSIMIEMQIHDVSPLGEPLCNVDDLTYEYFLQLNEAKYQGRTVELNKPTRSSEGKKKFHVYVKNPKGKVVKVSFGDPKMSIKKHNPKKRKSFRARHNCKNPGPRHKARYWSCRMW